MIEQLELFDAQSPLPALPPLARLVRYYDDYDRQQRRLENLDSDVWRIHVNGGSSSWDYARFPEPARSVLKRVFSETLIAHSSTSAISFWSALAAADSDLLGESVNNALRESPVEFRFWWTAHARGRFSRSQAVAFRHVLHWFCRWEIGEWRQPDRDLVRALPGHAYEKYMSVGDRSSIVPQQAKSKIVSYLDEASAAAKAGKCSPEMARDAAILAIAYQHGLRPRQIAMLEASDVRIIDAQTVHIRPTLIKQRGENIGRSINRKIQPEWTALFVRWASHRAETVKFFEIRPIVVGQIIKSMTAEISGTPYTARELRHTGAQRLADNGASRESVSEYLGHTDTTSANIYFESSPDQNMLVNAALGESPTYLSVAAAARGQLITAADLAGRPADQQIAGMPHGVPIAGIGACAAGQSLCSRNPVLACYTCHKFLPVSEGAVHRQVLSDLKDVVRGFDQPARLDRVSPAMMQLRSTLEAINAVLGDIGETHQ